MNDDDLLNLVLTNDANGPPATQFANVQDLYNRNSAEKNMFVNGDYGGKP